MTERIYCSVIQQDEVEVNGSSVTFTFAGEKHSYYLSPEAMKVLLEKLPGSLYDEMASENIRLQRIIDANHDAIYGGDE